MSETTSDEWAHLFSCLGDDQAAAEREYASIREYLLRFFSWRRCDDPGALADETISRVANYLYGRGERITATKKVSLFGVMALNVWREARREQERRSRVEALYQMIATATDPKEVEAGKLRLEFVHEVIEELPETDRRMVVDYYRGSGGKKIRNRKKLAAELGISVGTLRKRATRVRGKIQEAMNG